MGVEVNPAALQLETARLTLRPLRDDDLEPLWHLLRDRDALALWGEPLDREGTRAWIERNQDRYAVCGFGRCAVVLRATGELVGDCGLAPTVVEGIPETELGWIVARSHWGEGIATEAGHAWCDHAFTRLRLDRIVSIISEGNLASRRVAEKLGMALERPAVWNDAPMLMYVRDPPTRRRTDVQNAAADMTLNRACDRRDSRCFVGRAEGA